MSEDEEDEQSTVEQIKELKREGNDDASVDFKVYDMPISLIQKYISMAKLRYDNQVWKVLEKGMKLMQEEETTWKDRVDEKLEEHKKRIKALDTKIGKLKVEMNNKEEQFEKDTEGRKDTFGESNSEEN